MRLEEASKSTRENAELAVRLFPARRILLVSDTYHLLRATRVFERHYDDVTPVAATPELWVGVRGSLREVVALLWYGARGWL
jgi:uncharacterized SAM-binding protein YcdF (DUF218 family)